MKRALDYGCGKTSMEAVRSLGYKIVGVDIRHRPGCHPMVLFDGRQLPFKDHVFDLIVSQQVIEHVGDLESYFGEAARVLNSGGSMFCEFPHRLMPRDSHSGWWFQHWFRRWPHRGEYLKLRWPWIIRRQAKRFFHIEDITRARLKLTRKLSWLPLLYNQSWVLRCNAPIVRQN